MKALPTSYSWKSYEIFYNVILGLDPGIQTPLFPTTGFQLSRE
jgi:hypothetical protein